MLELICQQRYRAAGIPIDLSPYRNHGVANATAEMAGPDGTAITFPQPGSMVRIEPGTRGAWKPLSAVKIEIDVFVHTQEARTQFLIDADGTIQIAVDEFALSAWLPGPTGITHIRTADAWTGGRFIKIPNERWLTLGLYHDGYANLELSFDGRVVAKAMVDSGVGGVGPNGVAIGNRLAGGTPLHGAIEELRVWRADPRAMRREFLCRPFGEAAGCWEAIFRVIRQMAASQPDTIKVLADTLGPAFRQVMHDLALASPESLTAVTAANDDLMALWCAGDATTAETATAMAALVGAMEAANVKLPDSALADRLLPLLQGAGLDVTLDCDPWGRTYIDAIGQALVGAGPA